MKQFENKFGDYLTPQTSNKKFSNKVSKTKIRNPDPEPKPSISCSTSEVCGNHHVSGKKSCFIHHCRILTNKLVAPLALLWLGPHVRVGRESK